MRFLVIGSLAISGVAFGQSPMYRLTEIGDFGGDRAFPHDINNAGQIVGEAYNANGDQRAFIYEAGVLTDLGTLRGDNSGDAWAAAINENGTIVGTTDSDTQNRTGFIFKDGQMTELLALDQNFLTFARDVNDNDVVIGTQQPEWSLVRWEAGIAELVSSSYGDGYQLNNAGTILGGDSVVNIVVYNDEIRQLRSFIDTNNNEDYYYSRLTEDDRVLGGYYNGEIFCGISGCTQEYSTGLIYDIPTDSYNFVAGMIDIAGTNSYGWLAGASGNGPVLRLSPTETIEFSTVFDLSAYSYVRLVDMNERGDIIGNSFNPTTQKRSALLFEVVAPADMNVSPYDDSNQVDPLGSGNLSVALLTATEPGGEISFDATEVNLSSVKFGFGQAANVAVPWAVDADADGDTDMLFAFSIADAGILCADTDIELTGRMLGGTPFSAIDGIATTNCDGAVCHP